MQSDVASKERTADLDWSLQFEQYRLIDKYFPRLGAEKLDLVLCELDLLARSRAADLEQSRDDLVNVNVGVFH